MLMSRRNVVRATTVTREIRGVRVAHDDRLGDDREHVRYIDAPP